MFIYSNKHETCIILLWVYMYNIKSKSILLWVFQIIKLISFVMQFYLINYVYIFITYLVLEIVVANPNNKSEKLIFKFSQILFKIHLK